MQAWSNTREMQNESNLMLFDPNTNNALEQQGN